MGLADDQRYGKYHRVLNRDRWSPGVVSKILLGLLVRGFVPKVGTPNIRPLKYAKPHDFSPILATFTCFGQNNIAKTVKGKGHL
jgi:hypothetical protein